MRGQRTSEKGKRQADSQVRRAPLLLGQGLRPPGPVPSPTVPPHGAPGNKPSNRTGWSSPVTGQESHLGSSTLRRPSDNDKCQGRWWDQEGGKRGAPKKQHKAPRAEAIFRGRRRWPGTTPSGERSRELWSWRGWVGGCVYLCVLGGSRKHQVWKEPLPVDSVVGRSQCRCGGGHSEAPHPPKGRRE